jgi:hypothetical protein
MEAAEKDPWLREHPPEIEWPGGQSVPVEVSVDEPICQAVSRAHERVTGERPSVEGSAYGADMRFFVRLAKNAVRDVRGRRYRLGSLSRRIRWRLASASRKTRSSGEVDERGPGHPSRFPGPPYSPIYMPPAKSSFHGVVFGLNSFIEKQSHVASPLAPVRCPRILPAGAAYLPHRVPRYGVTPRRLPGRLGRPATTIREFWETPTLRALCRVVDVAQGVARRRARRGLAGGRSNQTCRNDLRSRFGQKKSTRLSIPQPMRRSPHS